MILFLVPRPFSTFATVVLFLFSAFLAQVLSRHASFENFETLSLKREKRWGNPWHNNYGNPPPNYIPYIPNNNVAIGYPTAYGLSMGFVRQGQGSGSYPGDPNQANQNSKPFPVRCMNGGAHIGQCRLDDDAICIALGGSCVNSACCTTPFISLRITSTTTTTEIPSIVDGEALRPKAESDSEEDVENDEKKKKSVEDAEDGSVEDEKLNEIEELSKLLELGRKSGLSTDSPIYAVFSGLFETTTPAPTFSTVVGLPEWSKMTTEVPTTLTTMTWKPQTTKMSKLIKTTTEMPSIESRSVEVDYGQDDYSKKYCENGLKPIGPCNDNGSCPIDHSCQKGDICCYDYALVMMSSILGKRPSKN